MIKSWLLFNNNSRCTQNSTGVRICIIFESTTHISLTIVIRYSYHFFCVMVVYLFVKDIFSKVQLNTYNNVTFCKNTLFVKQLFTFSHFAKHTHIEKSKMIQ